jgi:hypothetical protein
VTVAPGRIDVEQPDPPWVLQRHVVTVTRPQPPAIGITLPPTVAIDVSWPVVKVTGDPPPPPPRVIRLAAPPQGPWRLPFPGGHPLRNMALYDLPPRAAQGQASTR